MCIQWPQRIDDGIRAIETRIINSLYLRWVLRDEPWSSARLTNYLTTELSPDLVVVLKVEKDETTFCMLR